MASTSERPVHALRSALKHHSHGSSGGGASASSSSVFTLSSPPHSPPFLSTPLAAVSTASSTTTTFTNLNTPLLTAGASSSGYTPKVSFDTFENPDAPMFSFTLRASSEAYTRNRATRIFLCAASADESGTEALDWVMESLVQDGDELIVFRGFDTEVLDRDHDALRDQARDLLRLVQQKNNEYEIDRKLSIIVEFIAGRVTDTIDRLIALYRPDSLIVGTRGQRGVKVLGAAFGSMGSVSKYCLTHSPVPVIVVQPERKTRKMIMKRRLDPKRGTHFEDKSTLSVGSITKSPSITPSTTRQ